MQRFRFGSAMKGESTVFGAQRPGYDFHAVEVAAVHEWVNFMRDRGIQRVCCLLPRSQLSYYSNDLLGEYRSAFGASHVCHAPVEDLHLCEADTLEGKILPFLAESASRGLPVVVHCSGGSGRTGHVLAAWLVKHRGLTVEDALYQVAATSRNPREAVMCGNATDTQLRALLRGLPEERAV